MTPEIEKLYENLRNRADAVVAVATPTWAGKNLSASLADMALALDRLNAALAPKPTFRVGQWCMVDGCGPLPVGDVRSDGTRSSFVIMDTWP